MCIVPHPSFLSHEDPAPCRAFDRDTVAIRNDVEDGGVRMIAPCRGASSDASKILLHPLFELAMSKEVLRNG